MKLSALIKDMETVEIQADIDAEVTGIAYDSRAVRPGDLFVAVKGLHADGHDFMQDAVRRGARAVVSEHGDNCIVVRDSRDALARLSSEFYGRPSERLAVSGVTGTNGKTTAAFLIKSILEHSGRKAGLIGTINYMIGDKEYPAPHTTPEAPEFQGYLAKMVEAHCGCAVCEVSSHALALKRADYTDFKVAVFTNLTRDHLDFHGTMENYFEAKKRLFAELLSPNGTAVINADDPYAQRLIGATKAKVITYGIEKNADIKAHDIKNAFDGLSFKICLSGKVSFFGKGDMEIASPLVGIPNVYNILSACGAALALGAGWEEVASAIRVTGHAKGRFEKVETGRGFLCIVDYAHTDDALRRLIETARGLVKGGRVITVFGCGGDRDKGKRPLMGSVAATLSDEVFITSDNPRSEDPEEIIKDILAGVAKDNYKVEPDRRRAIFSAIILAKPGDIVLIAGKGHEEYQEEKGGRVRFSDKEVAEEALGRR